MKIFNPTFKQEPGDLCIAIFNTQLCSKTEKGRKKGNIIRQVKYTVLKVGKFLCDRLLSELCTLLETEVIRHVLNIHNYETRSLSHWIQTYESLMKQIHTDLLQQLMKPSWILLSYWSSGYFVQYPPDISNGIQSSLMNISGYPWIPQSDCYWESLRP